MSEDSVSDEFKRRYMDPGSLTSTYTRVNGLDMHARISVKPVAADAPAVVLIHGSGLSGRYMIPTATQLTDRFRVYLPDLPGFGRSAKPDVIYDVPALADWIHAWMPTVGLDRAAFLGNSFGCQVIADLAARHAERVNHAVLQGPTTPPDERSVLWQFIRWRQNAKYNPEWLGDISSKAYEQSGWWRMFRYFFIQISDAMEEKMPAIPAPVLVVRGEHDPIADQAWCEQLARLAPRGHLAVVPGAAHTMCFNAPEPLARVTGTFIEGERPCDAL